MIRTTNAKTTISKHRISDFIPSVIALGVVLFTKGADLELAIFYGGDAAVRLDKHDSLIVGVGTRAWLPFLQLHVYLLHLLNAPLEFFRLTPLLYSALACLLLNAIGARVLKDFSGSTFFLSILLTAFFNTEILEPLLLSLYQEPLVLAFAYALSYLFLFKSEKQALFLLCFALSLLVREYFWIYYVVYLGLPVLKNRNLKSLGQHFHALPLAIIPIVWLVLSDKVDSLGVVSAPAELLTLAHLKSRMYNLVLVFEMQSLLLPSILIFFLFFFINNAQTEARQSSSRDKALQTKLQNLHSYSIVSLLVMYEYIILANPWAATPLNSRAAFPFFLHLPMFLIFLYSQTKTLSEGRAKVLRGLILLASVMLIVPSYNQDPWMQQHLVERKYAKEDSHTLNSLVTSIEKLDAVRVDKTVSFWGMNYYEYTQYLVASFLYRERIFLPRWDKEKASDVLVAKAGEVPTSYRELERFSLSKMELALCIRKYNTD